MSKKQKALWTCASKKRYKTKTAATREAKMLAKKTGVSFRAYECPICFWHHLTSGGFVEPKANGHAQQIALLKAVP